MGNTSGRDDRKARSYERRAQVLSLRRAGLTYDQIGKQLGFSDHRAWHVVVEALDDLHERSRELAKYERDQQLDRLEALHRTWYPLAMGSPCTRERAARAPQAKAAEIVLRICERVSRLCGLDAPVKLDATVTPGDVTPQRAAEFVRAAFGAAVAKPTDEPTDEPADEPSGSAESTGSPAAE